MNRIRFPAALLLALPLSGCGMFHGAPRSFEGTVTSTGSVAVNGYLWHASLEVLSFLPISSADAFGGIIVTDWYVPPETPTERFKVNVYLVSSALRADGIRIVVFRQQQDDSGPGEDRWRDTAVGPEVASEFENAVLIRARDLRSKAGG